MALTDRLLFRAGINFFFCQAGCRGGTLPPALQLADHRLSETITYFHEQNDITLKAFQEKGKDPQSAAGFSVHAPGIRQIGSLSQLLLQHLDRLEELARSNKLNGHEGTSLYDSILCYADRVVSIVQTGDAGSMAIYVTPLQTANRAFRATLLMTMGMSKDSSSLALVSKSQWVAQNLGGLSAAIASLQLKTLKNDLLLAEYGLLCDWWKILSQEDDDDIHFAPLIVMDRSCVKAGENIRVTVGVNAYRTVSNMTLKIGEDVLKRNEHGVYEHSIVTRSPGAHELDLHLEYVKPNGEISIMGKKMKYYVER